MLTVTSILLFALPAAAQTPYEITDLGPMWGDASSAADLNDAGAVTGTVERVFPNWGSKFDPFLWRDGAATNLGHLRGDLAFGQAINASDQVAGYSSAGTLEIHGFLWESGVMSDLGFLTGDFSRAQAINDRGWLTGVSMSSTVVNHVRAFHPVVWYGGSIYELPSFGGLTSEGKGINDAGVVVGFSQDSSSRAQPFRFTLAGGMEALPKLVATGYGQATAIDDRGAIAGLCSDANDDPHAVLWWQGQITDLGTLGGPQSFAYGVNHDGLVVGSSGWAAGGGQGSHAFLWEGGAMHDLNALALPGHGFQTLVTAMAINDAGQIAGKGVTASGAVHAYLATPARFLLLGPETGVAGGVDSVELRNATPGAGLALVWGTRLGQGPPVSGCAGLQWGVADPRPLATVTADAAGSASVALPVPASFAGRYLVVQAVDTAACQLSTRLAFRYRP